MTTVPRCAQAAIVVIAILWTASTRADAPVGRYKAVGGVVSDLGTRLSWQQTSGTAKTQAEAVAYCAGLDLGGTGWRLPTVKELWTLVDETRTKPAIDPIFVCGPNEIALSSTPVARIPDLALYFVVAFSEGGSDYSVSPFSASVRCVRDGITR